MGRFMREKNPEGYYVYYGPKRQYFNLPYGWKVLKNSTVDKLNADLPPVEELVQSALLSPTSSARLKDMVNNETKIVVIVDDGTRSTPVSRILPIVLSELEKGGADRDNIDILIALGTHRMMDKDDAVQRIGKDIHDTCRINQHDCRADDLVSVGRLSTGGQTKINPLVANADVKIAIGSILPHVMNGFGGGAKLIMPGVSNYEAIREHHLNFTPDPNCYIGNLKSNPFYLEVVRVAEAAGLDFIINCVYDSLEQIEHVVAGSLKEAHGKGVELSMKNYAFTLDQEADITITSAFPYNEGPQIIKPLVPAALLATKPGGSVIMTATCREDIPEGMLSAFDRVYRQNPPHAGLYARETFRRDRLFIEGAIDFNCAIYFALVCAARNRITVVSRDLKRQGIERMGFTYAESLEEALEDEAGRVPAATVNIFPVGGLALPLKGGPPDLFATAEMA